MFWHFHTVLLLKDGVNSSVWWQGDMRDASQEHIVRYNITMLLSFLSSENMVGMFSAAMADILVFKQNLSSRDWHQSELGDGCDLQLVLWHATWRSDAVVHASVYTGSRWGKTKPCILLLYCEISMTLLTLPPSLDLSFKATYLHRVRMFFFFFCCFSCQF